MGVVSTSVTHVLMMRFAMQEFYLIYLVAFYLFILGKAPYK